MLINGLARGPWSTCLLDLREFGEVFLGDGPVEDVHVLLEPGLLGGLGQHAVPHLQPPAEGDLRGSLKQLLRHRRQSWITKHRAAAAHPGRAWRTEWRVPLKDGTP